MEYVCSIPNIPYSNRWQETYNFKGGKTCHVSGGRILGLQIKLQGLESLLRGMEGSLRHKAVLPTAPSQNLPKLVNRTKTNG